MIVSTGVVAVSVAEKMTFDERIDSAAKVIMTPSLILIWSFTDPIHPQVTSNTVLLKIMKRKQFLFILEKKTNFFSFLKRKLEKLVYCAFHVNIVVTHIEIICNILKKRHV